MFLLFLLSLIPPSLLFLFLLPLLLPLLFLLLLLLHSLLLFLLSYHLLLLLLGALSLSVTSGPRLSSCHSSGHVVLFHLHQVAPEWM